MKRFISLALVACFVACCGSAFAQEAPKDVKLADKPVVKVEKPERKLHVEALKPRIPHQVKNAFEFFKFADELKLTDDQVIQLRGYYKKHFSEPPKKLEKPSMPSPEDFYKMTEDEMNKFAENESKKVHDAIMSALQKVIDIKKILSPEQIETLKTMARDDARKDLSKMAEASRKAKEQKKQAEDCKKCKNDMMPQMGPKTPMMNGCPGMMPQMMPQAPKMNGFPGMMPQMMPQAPMMNGFPGMMPQMMPQAPMMNGFPGMKPQMGPGMEENKPCKMGFDKKAGLDKEANDFKCSPFFRFMKKVFDCQKHNECGINEVGIKNPKFDSLKKDGEKLPPLPMNKPEGPKAAPQGPAEK